MVEEDKEEEVEWRKMMMECKCSAVQVLCRCVVQMVVTVTTCNP